MCEDRVVCALIRPEQSAVGKEQGLQRWPKKVGQGERGTDPSKPQRAFQKQFSRGEKVGTGTFQKKHEKLTEAEFGVGTGKKRLGNEIKGYEGGGEKEESIRAERGLRELTVGKRRNRGRPEEKRERNGTYRKDY